MVRVLLFGLLSGCQAAQLAATDSGFEDGCPRLTVDDGALVWLDLLPGQQVDQTVEVTNDCEGASSLSVTALLGPGTDEGFVLSAFDVDLTPGTSGQVVVSFAGETLGDHDGTLLLENDDPSRGAVVIDLHATVGGDRDGDGFSVGEDCNDDDADIHPGADETLDIVDEDCDGLVDEDFVSQGDLILTELMVNPDSWPDSDAEWFEARNLTGHALDLIGWRVSTGDGASFVIGTNTRVESGARIIFGAELEPAINGGVTVQYVFDSTTFFLPDAGGSLAVWMGDLEISSVTWDSDWTLEPGYSIGLDPDHESAADMTDASWWCSAVSEMIGGDFGTPGAANDDCGQLDEDGDGFTGDDGDCDDHNKRVHPGADDPWNLFDDNCDEDIDYDDIDNVVSAGFVGDSSDFSAYLSASGIAIGDIDDDGIAEVVAGTFLGGNGYRGEVYALDASTTTSTAQVDDVAELIVQGSWNGYFGFVSQVFGDQTGDGVVDLVVGGSSYYDSDNPSLAMYQGGSSLTGSLDEGDATVALFGLNANSGVKIESALDFDGDGLDDLVRSNPTLSGISSIAIVFAATMTDGMDMDADADATLLADSSGDTLGVGLGGGDLDGDGLDDLLAGAPASSGGSWYVVLGSGLPDDGSVGDIAVAEVTATDSGDLFGGPARPVVADFDSDGEADVVLAGAASDAIYLFFGAGDLSGSVGAAKADVIVTGESGLGFSMAGGDRDGDGVTDLLVGDVSGVTRTSLIAWYQSYWPDDGDVWLFDGAALGAGEVSSTADRVGGAFTSDQQLLGCTVALGDVDGDGSVDAAVGAARASGRQGAVFVAR